MSAIDAEASIAMQEHAIELANFVQGNVPPVVVDNEERAKIIFTGIAHAVSTRDAQRELLAEYAKWETDVRPRLNAALTLVRGTPALEAWRKATIRDRRKPLLDRLAAWEMTALMCDADGNTELAQRAWQTARDLAKSRRTTRAVPEANARTA